MGLGLGQNGNDFSNGMVHIHGGTVTLPREVRAISLQHTWKALTMDKGLGTDLRQTTASGKVAGRTQELHQQRRGGPTANQRLLPSSVRQHLSGSGGAH
jgi:hypothetical protein